MATLIPALGAQLPRMTLEKTPGRRLEDKLDDDYLLWYDVLSARSNCTPTHRAAPSRGC